MCFVSSGVYAHWFHHLRGKPSEHPQLVVRLRRYRRHTESHSRNTRPRPDEAVQRLLIKEPRSRTRRSCYLKELVSRASNVGPLLKTISGFDGFHHFVSRLHVCFNVCIIYKYEVTKVANTL